MDALFEIAANVSTPLALGGFFAAAFFFVAKQVLAKNIFPRLSRRLASQIITLIIARLFVLSLVAMILGFLGFILPQLSPPRTVYTDEARAIAVLSVQFDEIQQVSDLFSGKTEEELRQDFGFDDMFQRNVDWLLARYRDSAFNEEFDIQSMLRVGDILMILEGGGGTVEYETGRFTREESNRIVTYLILPEQFQKMTNVLRRFSDSTFLSEHTRRLIQDYIADAEENAILLGDVLDEAARELPERFSSVQDDASPISLIWLNNRWVRRFNSLSPKAADIRDNLRVYVKVP